MRNGLLLAMVFGVVGCGVQDAVIDGADETDIADAPLLGQNGQDAADRTCNVVLRTAERIPYQGGYVTKCTTAGGCQVVWTGVLDLSAQAVAEGAKPYVLYKNIDQQTWSKVTAVRASGAPAGFQRYSYRLENKTLEDGMSFSSLQHARIDVIPYVLTSTGARLFDHNRLPGDFDVYPLNAGSGWSVRDDSAFCQPKPAVAPTLGFASGWRQTQHGALVAGQRAVITYALDRLDTCRGTHNGYPAWDIIASVRFSPGGQVVEGSVRGFNNPGGTPSNSGAISVPFAFDIPSGATGAEIWFKNFTGAGSTCEAWDSNLGSNYRFAVEARPFAAPVWVGNPGSSFNRACSRESGAPVSVRLDDYLAQRACMFVEADVYAPGLTDAAVKPEALYAQAELSLDGVALPAEELSFVSRVGNDYRFHYELPRTALLNGPKWSTLTYTLRFSTDGSTWLRDVPRTLVRDVTFCNPAWASCTP